MNKYLLRFYKHGNMRFISHLDLNRLFRRAIKKAEIKIAFSSGFNPHEKMNIIQPLSLGFESDGEYLEFVTITSYDYEDLLSLMNSSMPEGIHFESCSEIPMNVSMTNLTAAASYEVKVKLSEKDYNIIDVDKYLSRPEIMILKRDKKTKAMVEKDYKKYIFNIEKISFDDGIGKFSCLVRSANNETLNPLNLINSLLDYSGAEYSAETIRITRLDIYKQDNNEFISLGEFNE